MGEKINKFTEKHQGLTAGLFLGLTVLICFLLTFKFEGITLRNLEISSAENDELIYYYETAGVVDHGLPRGFFGYTEITARTGPFGAWSPVLLINFCILGKLFGWSLTRAVFYNAFMLILAVFLFGVFARPNRKQTILLAVFLASYTFLMYGVLSIVPEITCYSYAIVTVGLIYSCLKDNRSYKIVLMFVTAVLLTLMRPYYAGLLIPAAYFLYKRSGKKSLFCSVPVSLATFYAFFFIGENFCAGNPMSGSFSKVIVKVIHNKDNYYLCSQYTVALLSGIGQFMLRLAKGLYSMFQQLVVFFTTRVWGRNYFMFFYLFLLLFVLVIRTDRKSETDRFIRRAFWLVYYFLMIIAVALYFTGWAADRHLAEFVVMGIVVTAMEAGEDKNNKWLAVLVEAGLIFSVIMVPNREREYVSEDFIVQVEEAKETLAKEMPLNESDGLSWDNTVLWVYEDTVDGEKVIVPWRALYAVPSGYAFNLVFRDTWFDEYENLSSKYLAAASGSDTELRFAERGAEKIADYCGVVIYRLR